MNSVRILFIEDDPSDALLVAKLLTGKRLDFSITLTRAGTLAEGLGCLQKQTFDAILTDLGLPDSHGLHAVEELHKQAGDVPVIVLTVDGDSESALAAIKAGAQDYLPKGQLSGLLLARTILYAIEREKARAGREKLIADLQTALAEVKTLSGLLPICGSCKKVRDDKGYWNQIETYIAKHTAASFSHGLCPDCGETFLRDAGIKRPPKGDK